MTFEEFKEAIKAAYVKFAADLGKTVENPDEIFAYVTEKTVMELYERKVKPEEAYLACALASIKIKKGGK